MRTGLLAQALINRGHEITWWKSTFEHVSKTHYRMGHGMERLDSRLTVGWLHTRGYTRHVSIERALDHRELGRHFHFLAPDEPPPNLLVCSYPVPELALAGVQFGNRRGIPVVVDVRDWWPEALVYTLPPAVRPLMNIILRPYTKAARATFRNASAITGITPAFVDWGLLRAGRPRTVFDRDFPHGYEVARVEDRAASAARRYWDQIGVLAGESGTYVAFIGSVSRSFDFRPLLSAAGDLADVRPRIRFVICGDGDRLPAVQQEAGGLTNVIFTKRWVGSAEIQELLRRATFGLVPLPDRPDFLATINNKTVEYLSAGLPIIVSPTNSWVGKLASAHGFGIAWGGTDPKELSGAIKQMAANPAVLKDMSSRARAYYEGHFVADKVYGGFAAFLEDLAGPPQ